MAAKFVTKGYGQVEPNRLNGIVTGTLESQAPAYTTNAGTAPIPQLENGMFLCVIADKNGVSPLGRIAVLPGAAEPKAVPYLVFNEKKLYDERQVYSDFVQKAESEVGGVLYPRLVGLTADNCVFTTNTINENAGTLNVGDLLYVGNDGYLTKTAAKNTTYQFVVTKVYTMPDGQEGVKLAVQVKA